MRLQICSIWTSLMMLMGCATVQAESELVFHCTFDDAQSILSPVVGPSGHTNGATFVEGRFGKALYVPAHSAVAEFPFPNGLPAESGTIDFWAKLEGDKETFGVAGDPYLFAIMSADAKKILFEMHFNSNNGCGKEGIIFGLPGAAGDALPARGNSYAQVLGDDFMGWHHYEVSWDVTSSQPIISLAIDGKKSIEVKKSPEWANKFVANMSRSVLLGFSLENLSIGNSPFAIDELKIILNQY